LAVRPIRAAGNHVESHMTLGKAAALIRQLVLDNDRFVSRIRGSITRASLDAHFFIRSTESGFSYRWGEVASLVDEGGFKGLGAATRNRFAKLADYEWYYAEDISFWALMAWHGFVDPNTYGQVLDAYGGDNSPMALSSHKWKLTVFLSDLRRGAGGKVGKTFEDAFQAVDTHKCWLPRWKKRPYYGLKNSYLLMTRYGGSFEEFLKSAVRPVVSGDLEWRDLAEVEDETWRAIAPWKPLYGVGENIFLYILRDVGFGDSRAKDAFKLDSRNMAFFDENGLWELGGDNKSKSNENAVNILRAILDRIGNEYPEWGYTVADANAAIYIAGKKITA
jgi:hypothetical protein